MGRYYVGERRRSGIFEHGHFSGVFGAIDLISAAYHFMLWNRNGRKCMDDDDSSLFSDWKSGERSPVKVSLAFIAGIIALALVIVMQG